MYPESLPTAASILHMIQHVVGMEQFEIALSMVIKQYFKSQQPYSIEDLCHALQVVNGNSTGQKWSLNVHFILDKWINQPNFPLVKVKLSKIYRLLLTQKPFYDYDRRTNISYWPIPINMATRSQPYFNDTQPIDWMPAQHMHITQIFVRRGDWFILNIRQTGYYRVKYNLRNYALLTKALIREPNVIDVVNRAQLIDDAFELAKHNFLNYVVVLNLTKYLARETEYAPWSTAIRRLVELEILLSNTAVRGAFVVS